MSKEILEKLNLMSTTINNKLDKIINVIGIDITDNKPVQETLINKLENIDKKIDNLLAITTSMTNVLNEKNLLSEDNDKVLVGGKEHTL